jgi:hypothetical protein
MFGDRKKLLMGGGVVAALVLAMWVMWPASPAPSASAPAAPARGAQQGGPDAKPPVAPVNLEVLAAERVEPSEGTRNPFRYQPKAPPPPPKQAATAPPPTQQTLVEPARPIVPPGPPPPPPIPLKFIGVLERANGEKWAVLSDGKVTLHGRDGDIVDGRYRIVKIGTESIELSYVDGRGRQVVRLTGQ